MRSVSRRKRHMVALMVLFTVLVAQGAAASERRVSRGLLDRIDQARRFIVTIFSRFGTPPGDEEQPDPVNPLPGDAEQSGRFGTPPG
jgi:hypothetical protein